jgi:hypothetical protein
MVDLLDNFLNLLNLFFGCGDFRKTLRWRMGRAKERKINGGSATINQKSDREKELQQSHCKYCRECYNKYSS